MADWWFGTCGLFVHSVGNFIIPTDELHHFSEGKGSTTNQVWFNHQTSRFVHQTSGFIIYICIYIFPACVARVPVSLWESGGWGCVRSTLCKRSQPFATVRNRSQPPHIHMRAMVVPVWQVHASSAKGVTFGGFQRRVASFRNLHVLTTGRSLDNAIRKKHTRCLLPAEI